MRSRTLTLGLLAVLAAAGLAATTLAAPPLAHARGSVSIANTTDNTSTIDPTYATELRVSGTGFQVVEGGHGGVYVFFGTVNGTWRPSQGGRSGRNYLYVPDSETRSNAGYQRFLAFPGSDTGEAAQGTLNRDGTWSTTISVPGARFQAVGRDGQPRTVDCRQVTCGIITIGAHGVTNANNETFTPVRVADLYDVPGASPPPATVQPGSPAADRDQAAPGGSETEAPGVDEVEVEDVAEETDLEPSLEVDRASATAGRTLAFSGAGLPARAQVSAVLDDGVAANGPFLVGDDGRVTGVIALPPDLAAGTHELRLYGLGEDVESPLVRFAVSADDRAEDLVVAAAATDADVSQRWGPLFLGAAVLVLVGALGRLLLLRRAVRHG